MKLELKYLAPYLPYELEFIDTDRNNIRKIKSLHQSSVMTDLYHGIVPFHRVKPILKPMEEAEVYFKGLYGMLGHEDVTDFMDSDFLYEKGLTIEGLKYWEAEFIPYGTLKVLLKHHFDVFGLIVEKLAIDINKIE